ncbi:unnamed protein product [Trichogramma brassicae]|uniref:Reverse transcriptase domain-containing protein n=1 Tax=Trichogramma brassicae TaxID=86971 RepID=A0A6H5I6Z2_9HYME|nr:unnamed protein product [Trichogramma brassicae]
MRILQLNLNHCEAAQDLLCDTISRLRIDVAILCEQYKNLAPPNTWLADADGQAAIWVHGGILVQERPARGSSIVDLKFVCETLTPRVLSWTVSGLYTHSDHQAIVFEIEDDGASSRPSTRRSYRWNARTLDVDRFSAVVSSASVAPGTAEDMASSLISVITGACDASMSKANPRRRREPVYWWTPKIADLRRSCLRARRLFQRSRGRHDEETHSANYASARRLLRVAIKTSKRRCWRQLCDEVNNDVWGKPYKIAMSRLGCPQAKQPSSPLLVCGAVAAPFPRMPSGPALRLPRRAEQPIPAVTLEELKGAQSRIKERSAPGPDGIPNSALKIAIAARPDIFLRVYTLCLETGVFPSGWKCQRLVLLPKPGKPPDEPSSYRPLCMLDTAGHRRQEIYSGTKKYCAVVTLDVRNAFNSVRWDNILAALRRLLVPDYLLRIIASYFSARVLDFTTDEGPESYEVTAGVPQGSVLCPILWNVMYDAILRLNFDGDVRIVGFAGRHRSGGCGLASMADRTRSECCCPTDGRTERTSSCAATTDTRASTTGTTTAKTTDRSTSTSERAIEISLSFVRVAITTSHDSRVWAAGRPSADYVSSRRYAQRKSSRANARSGPARDGGSSGGSGEPLLESRPRSGADPSEAEKRRRSAEFGVTYSACLIIRDFGVYHGLMAGQYPRAHLRQAESIHRRTCLRIISGRPHLSHESTYVLASIPPLALLADERDRLFHRHRDDAGRGNERQETLRRWQVQWDQSTKGRWTYRLIPDNKKWVERRHGEMAYHLTQLLTGHGYFRHHSQRYDNNASARCPVFPDETENAEHVFFHFPRFEREREGLQRHLSCARGGAGTTQKEDPGYVISLRSGKKTPITVRAGSDRITISRSPRRGLTKLAIDGAQHSHDEVRSENHTHKRAPDAGAKAQLERMMAPEARTTLTR